MPAERRAARLAAILLVALAGCSEPPAVTGAPEAGVTDVLWVTICTLRPDHLGAYGYERSTSPVIDGLARRGVLFERVLASAPWTRASVAGQISGLHPRALDIEEREAEINDRSLALEVDTIAEQMQRAGYRTLGVTANPNLNAAFHFDQGYDVYRDTGVLWREGYAGRKLAAGDTVAIFLEALDDGDPERPFFAHLVWVEPHLPYPGGAELGAPTPGRGPADAIRAYDRQIRRADATLGELLDALSRRGRSDLLVVLSSDHGEGFQEHHLDDLAHGHQLYDSTIWLPLILSHPGLPPRRVPGMVLGIDLAPTLLDLLGLPAPAPELPEALRGRSLARALLEGSPIPATPLHFVETAFGDADKSAVVGERWKLVADWKAPAPARLRLFDRSRDPTERQSVLERHPEVARDLVAMLEAFRAAPAASTSRAPRAEVPSETRRALEALGYVGDDTP